MPKDLGNRTEDSTIDFTFHTVNTSGVPTTLAGTPAISVYKANGTTESTAGITLSVDFDSRTGLNHVRIDTSADAFYAVSNDYAVVITTGTVGGTSVVGYTVATFSIENRFDEADVTQWSGSAVNALVSGRVDSSVGNMATDVVTAAAIAANAITSSELADAAITAAKFASGAVDATALATDAVNEIVDQVWDEAVADHVTVGSYGHLMRSLLAADGAVESSGSNSTTQLQTDLAEATDDQYIGNIIVFTDGDNAGQAAVITDYTGATGTLVFSPAVQDTASVGEKFVILGTSAFADVRSWLSTAVTTSATTAKPEVDAFSISDDAGAADNAELDYDGTGYNKSNSTIGTATALGADAVDSTSLANDAITAAKIAANAITSSEIANDAITADKIAADAIGASELAADAVTEIRDGVTGGAYALDTDANGRIRIVDGTGAGEIDTASGRVQVTEAQIDQIIDEAWDEAMSGHTTLGTFGQVLNALGARTGAVNDVSATSSGFVVDGFTEATDDHFNGHTLQFTSGALTGQGRVISDYTGSSQTLSFDRAFTEAPANNDEFVVIGPLAGVLSRVIATESDGQAHADTKEIEGSDATNQIRDAILSDATTFAGANIATILTNSSNIETDTQDIQNRLPAALVSGRMDSDAVAISGSTTAADDLQTFIAGTALGTLPKVQTNALANDAITAASIASNAIDDDAVATDIDTYQAKIFCFDDEANTTDRYVVVFFKNAQPVTSGITSPVIRIISSADGSDLIASTALTEVASTGLYKHNEATNRMTAGVAYLARTQATIDGSARVWYNPLGRDSTA